MRLLLLITIFSMGIQIQAQSVFLFVGTYTKGKSEGIYVYDFNTETGAAKLVSVAKGIENPSYLALSPNGRYLYSVVENGGGKPGELSAYSFDAATGNLRFLNKKATGGDDPCYVAVAPDDKYVVAGNYSGGNVAVFPVSADGSLGDQSELIQHSGSSVNTQRQEKAHVHSTVFSPDGRFVVVPDLGIDKLMIYQYDPKKKQPLLPAKTPFVNTDPGSGPRHFVFHPTLPFAYLIEELSGMVSVYSYSNGSFARIQRINNHPYDFTGKKGSADIHVSEDGKFLYASNRGESNTVAMFAIHPEDGKLSSLGFQTTMGETPRNFSIDPSGKWLLVANQESNNVVIFKRSVENGMLEYSGTSLEIPNPVCLKFLKKP
jgi:6-phosphogluconolactonase